MKPTRRTLGRIGLLYGLIIASINILGYLVISSQNMPIIQDETYMFWMNYMDEHSILISILSYCSFILPAILCVVYVEVCSKEKLSARIINIPIAYALFGSVGWLFSLIMELVILLSIRFTEHISMHAIAVNSFLNIVQCCIFITTLGFMALNTIHRNVVLPRLFPEGNIVLYPGSKKIPTQAIIIVFYFSTGVFPLFYAFSTLRNYSIIKNFKIPGSLYGMLFGVIVLSILLLIAVSSYFGRPLKKIGDATEDIKKGIYDNRIDFVSNDDFGILADSFNDMSHSIAEKNKRITTIQDSIIRGMAVMVESRDNSTGGHINRTSECVRVFVGKMKEDGRFKISDDFEKSMIKAAPMHDLGKIAVDDAILRKPGRFTPEEFEVMKKHSAEGSKIVSEVLRESDDETFKSIAENVAHYHHEKWDGSGYPERICGEKIPFEARIMALADVFDALVSKRCYKESMGYDKAFEIIKDSLGTHFDPEIGEFFISCRDDLENLYNQLQE